MLVKKLVNTYKSLLKTKLVLVQSVQTGILCGTGDVIAQVVTEKKSLKTINLYRTSIFVTMGSCFIGPTITTWYKFLSKTFKHSSKYVVLKKVCADQLLFVPPFQLCFLTILNTLQGHNFEFTKNQIKLKYTDILFANYKLWPAVQLVNFYFIPLSYQVLVVQLVALFWNSYLSWKTQYGIEANKKKQ